MSTELAKLQSAEEDDQSMRNVIEFSLVKSNVDESELCKLLQNLTERANTNANTLKVKNVIFRSLKMIFHICELFSRKNF